MPVIGFLNGASAWEYSHLADAFRQGLGETGHFESRNVVIEYRWAEGHYDRLPTLAADLVRRQVRVIAAAGGTQPALAAKAATTTIPIVFSIGADPVEAGLVASLNRPGGSLTGVVTLAVALGPKRLQLAHELVPAASSAALLINPSDAAQTDAKKAQEAARDLGLQLHILHASSERELDVAFATVLQLRAGVVVINADAFFNSRSKQLAELALRHAVPTVYQYREFAAAGGLASYGSRLADAYRQVGIYTGRILKGEKPADLPVVQSTKVELIINLKTAKSARPRSAAHAARPRRRGDRMIGRREFITLLGGAAAWPLAARAQRPAMPTIGFLDIRSPDGFEDRLRAFRQGLKDTGYVEGVNVAIDYRWAGNRLDQLPALATELVRRQVAVIATASTTSALAAKAATATIPIVFVSGADLFKWAWSPTSPDPTATSQASVLSRAS